MTFHLMCVHITFCPVSVAVWPTFWKYLLTRLTICSLCILTICNISYLPFWFLGLGLCFDCFGSWSLNTFYSYCRHVRTRILRASQTVVCVLKMKFVLLLIRKP